MRFSYGRTSIAASAFLFVALACASSSRGADLHRIDSHVVPRVEEAIAIAPAVREVSDVEFGAWRGTSFGSYLAPKSLVVSDDGGIDFIFHFHAAQMADKEWRGSHANAVIVSATFGIGSGAYENAFTNPAKFGQMMSEVIRSLKANKVIESAPGIDFHPRRVSLVAWSAGYGAVAKILAVPRWFDMIDTVVLLDGLHCGYLTPVDANVPRAMSPENVDVKMIDPFIRFAAQAALGNKEMVMTHSSIMPPDYASTTETMDALLATINVSRETIAAEPSPHDMLLIERADKGDLHMRGFAGESAKDHIHHLHLVEDAMRDFVIPRWLRIDSK
jgi:hypothetical protein